MDTIAKMTMRYKGKDYKYEHNFGAGFSAENAHFMFHDGNYGCDCNKSLFLSTVYPEIKEMSCGDQIEMIDFKVDFISTGAAQ